MKSERLLYSIGDIADRYISEAGEEETRRGRGAALFRKTALLVAIVAAAALLCAAGIYAVTGGDLWLQIPAKDPEKVVQKALESQMGKDYTVSIEVESVAVDPEETVRVREQFISGAIALWRGWSDEYLAEHFVVVKAVYHAEYDHAKTTRSDGDVVMYFYLARDVDSGRWEIVDNSGNMNLLKEPEPEASTPAPGGNTPGPEVSAPAPEAAGTPAPAGPDPIQASDPEEAVRMTLEGQVGSEYMVGIQVESAAVDPEETDRVREELIARGVAQRQGWSEEYLTGHFTVVKAFYCAEYDREKTMRGIHKDDVKEYFYLVQDADSGLWSVIDRSGNTDSKWEYSAPVPLSWQEQIKTYLSDLFTRAYSPYYDGLHYEMRHYEETVEDGVCTATFLWTMYNLGKGWDIGSDEGVEQQGNMPLQATAAVDDSGMLDMSTILVFADVSVNGPPDYALIEKYSAVQPRIQWRKQIMDYMSERYTEKYSAQCDGDSLHYSMNYYEETTENGIYTATFIWAVYYPGGDGPYGPTTGADFYDLRVTAAFDDSGILDIDTVAILTEDRLADPPDISGPDAEILPAQTVGQ